MKITIAQGAFLPVPPLMGGAVEKVWHGLSQEFARLGHEVTYISRAFGELPREETLAGIRHLRIRGYDTPGSLTHLKLLDLFYSLRVRRTLPAADILVTHTFWLPMLVRTEKYGKLYVHVARFPRGQMRFYAHAARLQAISHAIKTAIEQQTPAVAPRVKVVPYPLPNSAFATVNDDLQNRRESLILYVGRIHPEKGIELLLKAFDRLICSGVKDWKLLLVGPWETRMGGGGADYYNKLRSAYSIHGDRIEWVGPVFEPERLNRYYRAASVFVYPSLAARGEAFGLAPLEAMAAGCAVVVSDLECFRDFLTSGQNGFRFDHQAMAPEAEIAETLLELLRSEEVRRGVATRGQETAANYRMHTIAEQYLADFQDVISSC